jgi:SLT domain-containing protein
MNGALHATPMDVPTVPPLAAANGAVIPGYAPGVDSVHAILSPGEGVLVPEAVRGLGGAPAIHAINAAYSSRLPGPTLKEGRAGFDGGGVWGDLFKIGTGAVGVPGIATAMGAKPSDVARILSDPLGGITTLIKGLMSGIGQVGPFIDMLGQMGLGLASGVGKAILGLIMPGGGTYANYMGGYSAAQLQNAGGTGQFGPILGNLVAGGGVERWRSTVDQVLAALGQPIALDNGVLSLIQHESGGNPYAINLSDSNARAGHPSQGLMQTIPSTFMAYAGPYASRGIDDPFANIYAGVNYALHTYGSAMLGAGGRHNAAGQYIGYDAGGTLPPGPSLVYNGTGQPEIVAPRQTFDQIMSGASGGAVPPKMTVYAQFGTETIEARTVRVVTDAFDLATSRGGNNF